MSQHTPPPCRCTPSRKWDPAVGQIMHTINWCPLHAAAPDLLAALEQIAKGEGAFNRDPLKHAENVIEEHKALARAALAKAKGEQR